ncbi:MAG TPA: CBS domain-containing protein [Aequorivita sp.]|nr:CBS domain-containing protein [Aequorivita sp.]
METQNYIINDVVPIDISSQIKETQTVFNQLTYSHIPVVKDGHYIGCISENDAYCFENNKQLIEFEYALEPFYVLEDTNWLDILEAFALHKTNIMPVLGKDNSYMGYYELGDIMSLFNNTPFLNETGGIIVVEKAQQDYSFSEICQIVETNGSRIFGVFISKMENGIVQATLKVGHTGINSIVQTFRRYGYDVVSHHEEDKFIEDLKERSQYLDKYLNI